MMKFSNSLHISVAKTFLWFQVQNLVSTIEQKKKIQDVFVHQERSVRPENPW
jgi:hypothetical protein